MERRLGKGLGSLLGDAPAAAPTTEVEVDRISPNPHQPRKDFDPQGLSELESSIRQHGVLQPLVVMKKGARYILVAGERRLRAAREAGLARVPVVVRDALSEGDLLELALVENVQRRDLNPIERATGYREMMLKLSITQEAVAEKVGLRRSTVANHLRLLDLPAEVQDAVRQGLISMGHARALLALQEPKRIEKALREIVKGDLSVRDVEQLVRNQNHTSNDAAGSAQASDRSPAWLTELENRLRDALGTKVMLKHTSSGAGQLVVQYFSLEELERLSERIAPKRKLS